MKKSLEGLSRREMAASLALGLGGAVRSDAGDLPISENDVEFKTPAGSCEAGFF